MEMSVLNKKSLKVGYFQGFSPINGGVYLGGFTEINRGEGENRGEKSGGI